MLKAAARTALHGLGGLAFLRWKNRRRFGVPVFHSFSEADRPNVEAFCEHIASRFEPVSLSTIVDAISGRGRLPARAITVTIDDGYRNFLVHGHPLFRRYRIPTTIYVVSDFACGRFWLWTDRISFAFQHTGETSVEARIDNGLTLQLALSTAEEKGKSAARLTAVLKEVTDERRLAFLSTLPTLCKLEIPSQPPVDRAALSWEELQGLAAEGVEIGCHTQTHPILSRLSNHSDLIREIHGAKQQMEARLGFDVRHFCYPNGKKPDIGENAIRCVRESGYASAVTCTWGLDTVQANPFEIARIPLDSGIGFAYGMELLAGLHM